MLTRASSSHLHRHRLFKCVGPPERDNHAKRTPTVVRLPVKLQIDESNTRMSCFASYSAGQAHFSRQTESDQRRAELRLSDHWDAFAKENPQKWAQMKENLTVTPDRFGVEVPSSPAPTLDPETFQKNFQNLLKFLLEPLRSRLRNKQVLKSRFNRFRKVNTPSGASFSLERNSSSRLNSD